MSQVSWVFWFVCLFFESRMFCDEISFLEEQLILTRTTLTPDTILPTRNISTRAAAQYLHLPSRTSFFLKSHMTMFIPSGKFTSSGSSHECKQDFLDGGCSGWMGQQRSSIVDFVACVTLPQPNTYLKVLLPVPLSDTMTEQVWACKEIATQEEQRSWLKLRQFR